MISVSMVGVSSEFDKIFVKFTTYKIGNQRSARFEKGGQSHRGNSISGLIKNRFVAVEKCICVKDDGAASLGA